MSFLINPYIYAVSGPTCSGDLISTVSLAAYYKFNGDATDDSGNALDLTENASPTYTSGKFGDAATLDGTSQYYNIADNTLLEGSGGTLSVFGWIKITDFSSDSNQHLAAKLAASSGWRIWCLSDGSMGVTLGNSAFFAAPAATISTGVWTHIGFTYNNNTWIGYVNGSQTGTNSIGAKTLSSTQGMTIGRRNNGADGYVKGQIDDVSIWQRVITPTEVSDLYSTGCPLKS